MKQFLIICIIALALLIICLKSCAQPKGTNEITIHGVTFEQVVTALLDSGFKIEAIDKDFKIATTKPFGQFNIVISIRAKDSSVIIDGIWSNGSHITFQIAQTKKEFVEPKKKTFVIFSSEATVQSFAYMRTFCLAFNTQVEYKENPNLRNHY